jgi:hypothetical protein
MTSAVAPAFTAAHGMRYRVLCLAANVTSATFMSCPSRLTPPDVLIVRVAQLAYCRTAFLANHSHLAAGQLKRYPVAFFGYYSRRPAGNTH